MNLLRQPSPQLANSITHQKKSKESLRYDSETLRYQFCFSLSDYSRKEVQPGFKFTLQIIDRRGENRINMLEDSSVITGVVQNVKH